MLCITGFHGHIRFEQRWLLCIHAFSVVQERECAQQVSADIQAAPGLLWFSHLVGARGKLCTASCVLALSWLKHSHDERAWPDFRTVEPVVWRQGLLSKYTACMARQVIATVLCLFPGDLTASGWSEALSRQGAVLDALLCEYFADGEGPPRPSPGGNLQPPQYFSGLLPARLWTRAAGKV